MSFSLWLINTLFKAAGVKKMYDRPQAEINEMTRKKNAKRVFAIPESDVFSVTQLMVDGREVLWLKHKPEGSKRAFFIFTEAVLHPSFPAWRKSLHRSWEKPPGGMYGSPGIRTEWTIRFPQSMRWPWIPMLRC